jgi:hypothetical protein
MLQGYVRNFVHLFFGGNDLDGNHTLFIQDASGRFYPLASGWWQDSQATRDSSNTLIPFSVMACSDWSAVVELTRHHYLPDEHGPSSFDQQKCTQRLLGSPDPRKGRFLWFSF